jgi:hypothetical protein
VTKWTSDKKQKLKYKKSQPETDLPLAEKFKKFQNTNIKLQIKRSEIPPPDNNQSVS